MTGSVDVIDPPTAVPGTIGLLIALDKAQGLLHNAVIAWETCQA
jgi:hypothetical protein